MLNPTKMGEQIMSVIRFLWSFRTIAPLVAASLLVLSPTAAQQVPQEVDGLAASPDNFRLVLENEQVRILEYHIDPGIRDRPHTHSPRVSHVISGGTLRIRMATGETFDVTEGAGETHWSGAAPLYDTENIGNTPIRILLIELKAGDGL